MYNIFTKCFDHYWKGRFLMRISIVNLILLISGIQFLAAKNGNSQNLDSIRVTVEMKNGSLEDLFRQIEQQTTLKFVYGQYISEGQLYISIPKGIRTVKSTLDLGLAGTDLAYQQKNENVVIYPNKIPKYTKKEKRRKIDNRVIQTLRRLDRFVSQDIIQGTVVDQSGEPLIGVNILVKGTNKGTSTDFNGQFTLEDVDENAVLVVSYVGYQTQEVLMDGNTNLTITMISDTQLLDEVVVIGYGTVKKSDLTGSVTSINRDNFKNLSVSQVSDVLAGTIAGLNAAQATSAEGGSSLEIRGPTSLNAGTDPLIVLDGVIFSGQLNEINFSDVEKVDVLKDASAAAVYGAKAASGVVIITTRKGQRGKPVIGFSTRFGFTESYNQRKGLGPDEFLDYRKDFFQQTDPELYNTGYYANPNDLPEGLSIDEWRNLDDAPLEDNLREWMARMNFYDIEQKNYLAGKTTDWYDQVFRTGLRQKHDVNISGGSDLLTYFSSVGYTDYEGILLGDNYSALHARLNLDFNITNWLTVGVNTQFTNQDYGKTGTADQYTYANSPYGEVFDDDGNLRRLPHGHTPTPLLDFYRDSKLDKSNALLANLYGNIQLPFGFNFKISYQPYIDATKDFVFTTISQELGGLPGEVPTSTRRESTTMNWMVDNLLTWKKRIGIHNFDLTLLANFEENQYWSSNINNMNFLPNQELRYHALQFGDSPGISNNDTRSTGDALMARINYTLMDRYLLTGSVRRDGYSAFGTEHPRAVFPALAFAWVMSEESFFTSDLINRLKLRVSWGVNGNRDIGIYSALARSRAELWNDGNNTRVGVYNSTLANPGLQWEKTESINLGVDFSLLEDRIELSADVYDMTSTNVLMERLLPKITGFSSITVNLGELENKGLEMSLNSVNINQSDFTWSSNLVFSLNRNRIKKLFGDIQTYTLLGEQQTGEVPDYTNEWFPGHAIDVVWNYDVTGIWQPDEKDAAAEYNMEPGDFKAVDLDNDGSYVNINDKNFIGYRRPRYRVGLRNDFRFLQRFTASLFLRADLGHMRAFPDALNRGWEESYKRNRIQGPVPYWTVDNQINDYARINPYLGAFGGGIMIYKPTSFVRIQDASLSYDLSSSPFIVERLNLKSMQIYGSVRNLATFTKWPGWDPESGMTAMPRTYTFGLKFTL